MGARRASILFAKLGIPIQSRDPFRLPGIVPKAWFLGPVTRLRGNIDCSPVVSLVLYTTKCFASNRLHGKNGGFSIIVRLFIQRR